MPHSSSASPSSGMTSDSRAPRKILVIGKGAREHALVWKLVQSPTVGHVYVVPGNGGTAMLFGATNLEDVDETNYPGLVDLAKALDIGLVVFGPDHAVIGGIEKYFRYVNIPCFALIQEAAELEGSKTFAKGFMDRHKIPTAEYEVFEHYEDASKYVEEQMRMHRIVIKADGLAAGKGVFLPESLHEAYEALQDIMLRRRNGASQSVVIEEYLEGEEISVLSFCDGIMVRTLPPGQDHKRIREGNEGPNTGGMGVLAPLPFITNEHMAVIEEQILTPTMKGMIAEGRPFRGMLFTGVMMTSKGPKVLEYNTRFGDPETQSMMLLMCDIHLDQLLLDCCRGLLHSWQLNICSGYACNVVVSAAGYPDDYRIGDIITLEAEPKGIILPARL